MAVIDTNSNCLNAVPDLNKRGVTAVGRYYTTYHPSYQVTKPEAQALLKGGIQLFMVFENCANPVLDKDHGKRDAKLALQQAQALGQPHSSAIYFAAEGLPDGYHQSDVKNAVRYFEGIAEVLAGKYDVGTYSNGLVCDALLRAGTCKYAWLSASMSFDGSRDFYASRRWAISQRTPVDLDWDGLSVDLNEVNGAFGAFAKLDA